MSVALRLDWCSHAAAKYAVEHWHYSKTIPASRSNYIGVWEDGKFIGVVIFSLGASPALGKPYGLKGTECSELTRVALASHQSSVTRIIRIALKMVQKKNPGVRLIISFADPFHDHIGGIYQGGNWIYTGKTSPSEVIELPDGFIADPRRFNGHGHNSPKAIPAGSKKVKTPGKYRYAMPLDDRLRSRIAAMKKPYPKRVGSAASGTTTPIVGGGATPTPTLHYAHVDEASVRETRENLIG